MKIRSILPQNCLGISLILLLSSVQIHAQFSQLYGNSSNNFFNRLIPDGQDFYVLGRDDGKATVSRINSAGVLSWTRVIDMPSRLTDGMVVAGSGNMIVVGATIPVDSSNHSILGEITRQGVFTCLKTLDVPGPEALTRMDKNADGTFSVVGTQTLPGFTQDVFVLNVSPGCLINSKKLITSPGVDNFANDIKVLCNGNFLVAGDQDGRAVMLEFSPTGQYVTGSQNPFNYTYNDIANTSNCDILAVANSVVSAPPIIQRFDASWLPLWEASIVGLQTLNKVIEDGNGNILVTGRALIGGVTRSVVLKIDDSNGSPILSWGGARYIENSESSFVGGSLALPISGGIAIIDGRDGNPNGFGLPDAFIAYTDDDLTSDCTRELVLDVVIDSTLFEGPIIEIFNYDVPPETMVTYSSVDWEQREACSGNPNPDSCVCSMPEFSLTYDGVDYPLSCLPHGGQTPVVGCATGLVTTGGFFGCIDPLTGEPCPIETPVIWVLTGPNGSPIYSGTTNNYTSFIFQPSDFLINGTYTLTLSTLCPGQQDSCVCMLDWIVECDPCCQDSLAFITAAQNVQASGQLGELCDISYTTDGLSDCTEITFSWGDGQSTGPLVGGSASVSHSYRSGGVYNVCYTVYEINNSDTCWAYTQCEPIQIVCDTCFCKSPGFTDMRLHWDNGPGIPIQCETSYDGIPCPQPGDGYFFTGKFECEGDSCEVIPYVSWELTGPTGFHFGSVQASPYFGIHLLPSQISQNGIYTMSLTSFCGTDTCRCDFQFAVQCDTLCPCDLDVVNALQLAVGQGFAVSSSTTSCKVCFTPIALTDCEKVDWHVSNSSGPLLGSSNGNQTFCHTFSSSGPYTIVMVVTRLKPDGTLCESFVKSKIINVACIVNPACNNSSLRNSSFSEGAIAGGFNSGGASDGWSSIHEEIEVIEGALGSLEGWSLRLFGNLDKASVLTSVEAICLARDTGLITLRLEGEPIPGAPQVPTGRGRSSSLAFYVSQGNNFEIGNCEEQNCYHIATIPIEDFMNGEWYDIEVPYDLRGWNLSDTCGSGALIRPVLFVTNDINSIQGGEETYSYAQIDNFCLDGMTVAVSNPFDYHRIRIFPNPTTGLLNIEMPNIIQSDISLQIISLTGQQMLVKASEPGISVQTIDASALPQGMYFLQVLSKGQVIAVNKFVKQ